MRMFYKNLGLKSPSSTDQLRITKYEIKKNGPLETSEASHNWVQMLARLPILRDTTHIHTRDNEWYKWSSCALCIPLRNWLVLSNYGPVTIYLYVIYFTLYLYIIFRFLLILLALDIFLSIYHDLIYMKLYSPWRQFVAFNVNIY